MAQQPCEVHNAEVAAALQDQGAVVHQLAAPNPAVANAPAPNNVSLFMQNFGFILLFLLCASCKCDICSLISLGLSYLFGFVFSSFLRQLPLLLLIFSVLFQ